jgi:hypothetical protein
MIIENEYSLQAAYLDKMPGLLNEEYYLTDVLEAYSAGTLTGRVKKKTERINLADGVAVADKRFYAPKEIENAKGLYETANQRITNANRDEVNKARAAILLYAHNKGAAETLGITNSELNKKLRSWGGYSAKARDISMRINNGVHSANRWTGIESVSWLNKATVTNDEVVRMVKAVEGNGDEYQNKYIARTMLSLDTHIDWSWLTVKFDSYAGVNASASSNTGRCNGYYNNKNRLVHVKRDAPNTVAHEMGHALDYQWGRELGYPHTPLTEITRNTDRISGEAKVWFDNFKEFADSLVAASDIRSEYSMDVKETFARFVSKFVEWTEQIGTGRTSGYESSFYNDKFTGAQFVQFARLLQEKSAIDAKGLTENKFSLSQDGTTSKYGKYHGKDMQLAPVAGKATVAENETVTETPITPVEDISPIDESLLADEGNAYSAETLGELARMEEEGAEWERRFTEAANAGDYVKFQEMLDSQEYKAYEARLAELRKQTAIAPEEAEYQSDRLANLTDADAPVQRENNPDMRGNQIPLDADSINVIADNVRKELGLNNRQTAQVRKLVEEYSMQEFPSREELFAAIKNRFGTYTETEVEDSIREAKAWIRESKIAVSDDIKQAIPDYGSWMRRHFGKIRFSKTGLPVDVAYQEMSGMHPSLFPESIITPADQLMRIAEVASMSDKVKTEKPIDDTALWGVADDIIEYVGAYQHSQKQAIAEEQSGEAFDSLMDDIAPVKETPEVKPETQQTVKAQIAKKIENFRRELDNNLRKREEASKDFDAEIARLQAEYDGKADKHTATAFDILRRIERKQRMKANVDADFAKRISDLEARIEKMSTSSYQTAAQRIAKQEEYTSLMEGLVGDTTYWRDKKLGIYYKTNTLRRNLRDVVRKHDGSRDIAKADAIYDELQGKYNHNEAELKRESAKIKQPYADLNITKAEDAYIQMLGELQSNPDTKLTQKVVEEFYEKHKGSIDKEKVDKVIADARKTYDDLLLRVNEVLKEQGMKEIPYRKGYFPHFTDEKQGFIAKLFNWKTQNNDIPTDIAGLTEAFNPNRSWQAFNKQRKGDTTDYSFTKGMDTYVHGALDWIYHIEDIQKRRAFENYIRYVHSEQGVKDRIDAIRASEEYDADEMQEQIDLVYAEASNPLNNFVTDLRAGTNTLANKKSSMDRGMEEATNRKVYSVMTNVSSRVSANMVGGSISSALTNFIPITQSWGEVSPISSLRAMGSTIASAVRDDGMIDKSDFLTNRLRQEESLYRTAWDKVSDTATIPMEAIDSFTSQVVWRSKYIENISRGMSESEAIKNADQFAENVMAGRSRGNQPTIFDSKNPLIKMLTAFQLEVNNQYGYMFKDMPQDMQNETKFKLAKGYVTMFLGAYAYNALFSKLTGRNAAFDPVRIIEELLRDLGVGGDDEEEEEEGIGGAIVNLADNILEDTPFVGGLVGGGRVPISSMLPYDGVYEAFEGTINDVAEKDWKSLTDEWLNPVYYLALPVGGGQLRKSVQGLSMFSDKHPVSGSYTKSGDLRFPVEDTIGNRIQAGLFGQYASDNARYYFDNDIAPLNEKQIQEFVDVEMPIRDYWDYRKDLNKQEKLEDKFDYIAGLDLTDKQKNILINNVVDRKEDVDISNYADFSGFEEFDFYSKNKEKYNFLKENGISYAAYNESEDSRKKYNGIYSWYKEASEEAPGKIALGKAVCDNLVEYRQYASDLNDIRADKDEDGDSISGSAKEKKLDYINSLDLDYGQKIILYRSLYDGNKDKDKYNGEILDYLNSRDDLTYEERVAILRELDFDVDEDGYATW